MGATKTDKSVTTMARRPKQDSILDLAISGNWKVSAFLALGLCVITYGVIPAITNPILKPMAMGLRPLAVFLIIVFVVIALFKLVGEQLKKTKPFALKHGDVPSKDVWRGTPPQSTEDLRSNQSYPYLGLRTGKTPGRPSDWSLQLIKDIEWKKFEELSTVYYLEKGIRAEATPLGADGGIDIKLYQDDSTTPTSIVQCKAWNTRLVGVKLIREFLGVMSHEKISKGFYMTSGDYSDDAKEVAKANQITLINGEMLLMMIRRLPENSQKKLLALATEGEYTTPSCPSCGIKMVKRSGKRGDFWGCRNYPRCRQMLHMRI